MDLKKKNGKKGKKSEFLVIGSRMVVTKGWCLGGGGRRKGYKKYMGSCHGANNNNNKEVLLFIGTEF